jgi:hypothetical protein
LLLHLLLNTGLLLGLTQAAPAQAQTRDFTVPTATLGSLCPGRLSPATRDLVVNETAGGIGAVYLDGLAEPGLMVQAIPVVQLGVGGSGAIAA